MSRTGMGWAVKAAAIGSGAVTVLGGIAGLALWLTTSTARAEAAAVRGDLTPRMTKVETEQTAADARLERMEQALLRVDSKVDQLLEQQCSR